MYNVLVVGRTLVVHVKRERSSGLNTLEIQCCSSSPCVLTIIVPHFATLSSWMQKTR